MKGPPFLRWKNLILYGLAVLFSVELASLVIVSGVEWFKQHYGIFNAAEQKERAGINARYGVDQDALELDIRHLYLDAPRFHSYRWFYLQENYQGKYVRTDAYGFRIDRDALDSTGKRIGFFGGSTMFSTTTRQEGTIPAQFDLRLDRKAAQSLNFGVGGYSSTTELFAFIEILRQERLHYAVFYDGVNEVARYVEKLQDAPSAPHFEVLGYFFPSTSLKAIDLFRGQAVAYELKLPIVVGYVGRVADRLLGRRNANLMVTEENALGHARRIIDIYVANVRDIAAVASAHGVTPVFFWQPDIYLFSGKRLTDRETRILEQNPAVRLLSQKVRELVREDRRLAEFRFFDLSDSLDSLGAQDHFFDYCHVSEEANHLIASAMAARLKGVLPDHYWKRTGG